ncbi:hypothetical protein BT69DRAFT_1319776 [Atractiella rhizophila]|nr:hypothetical protein BT69DRAFT_1319776 [Atractiella rhizophila]
MSLLSLPGVEHRHIARLSDVKLFHCSKAEDFFAIVLPPVSLSRLEMKMFTGGDRFPAGMMDNYAICQIARLMSYFPRWSLHLSDNRAWTDPRMLNNLFASTTSATQRATLDLRSWTWVRVLDLDNLLSEFTERLETAGVQKALPALQSLSILLQHEDPGPPEWRQQKKVDTATEERLRGALAHRGVKVYIREPMSYEKDEVLEFSDLQVFN